MFYVSLLFRSLQEILTSSSIELDKHNPKKQALNRALNACFLLADARIIEFLYRLILDLILVEDYFEMLKYTEPAPVINLEFRAQFKKEFGFDATTDAIHNDNFDFEREWPIIDYILHRLELAHPVLLRWQRQ